MCLCSADRSPFTQWWNDAATLSEVVRANAHGLMIWFLWTLKPADGKWCMGHVLGHRCAFTYPCAIWDALPYSSSKTQSHIIVFALSDFLPSSHIPLPLIVLAFHARMIWHESDLIIHLHTYAHVHTHTIYSYTSVIMSRDCALFII